MRQPPGPTSHGSATSLSPCSAGSVRHRDERGVVGREAARVAAERHREVEAEAVDAHDVRPVAQRVEGHPDHLGPPEVERVPRAGDVRERRGRPAVVRVVGGVVEAAPGQVLAGQPALAGVVVDDVEQHLEAGLVQRVDRAAQLGEHGRGTGRLRSRRREGRVRGEEAERAVAPVVGEALLDEVRLGGERVHRAAARSR